LTAQGIQSQTAVSRKACRDALIASLPDHRKANGTTKKRVRLQI
jgi:hypothetical protein